MSNRMIELPLVGPDTAFVSLDPEYVEAVSDLLGFSGTPVCLVYMAGSATEPFHVNLPRIRVIQILGAEHHRLLEDA